ncbi:bifunctional 3,4-dihydroxy-2-butanone-4-phosphate synthase/GTP cyclohydrolase II [Caulobacter sp. D4A]|uniref:3,4-dihydroxy-2-butanone-4-phosphate synthase n=1 Tax=unclassified Caulobacter TaxID=2648921 RepID=UPI000D728625|nr:MULTISPECIES: 3,4-dihydroxy-2-butanone-4-phosphate synthase [unclassified Caulobacter]PXA90392.1 bifunctional 3,4-dihydroxy-2-butanone-4-phosphate synthase/GTP cyclohydrolase II [Caulobacter sp. D4A]PXA92749.1 bifunctional 3,4-dihydroxy-2-butanone-4-phosphate synthase/GTP cyclohydrolase II [Caulobacter sp. D5]
MSRLPERLSVALERLETGGMIILVDDEDRENEGDLVQAAQFADAAAVAFMAKQASGLICLAMAAPLIDRLGLPPMVADNRTRRSTAFAVSIEATEGVDTGISAADRARTIQAAVAAGASPADIVSPGHVFPLRAVPGGVLARAGHTEASVELAKMAGLTPAAVICEIMNDDGTMARGDDLAAFAQRQDLPILSIAELRAHLIAADPPVEAVASARLPTRHGLFEARAFRSRLDGGEHLALVRGPLTGSPLVRVHSECLTGDAFGSRRCDCGAQLDAALAKIDASGNGVLVYLRGHEGRGIGLANKIAAYALQDQGLDTVEANHALGFPEDARDYGPAAAILRSLSVCEVRLLSNNPRKARALEDLGVAVRETLPLVVPPDPLSAGYLATKRAKLGHRLSVPPSRIPA